MAELDSRLIDELRARARQQEALAALGQRALAETDLSTLLDEAATVVARTLDVELCAILEAEPPGGEGPSAGSPLRMRAGVGWQAGQAILDAGEGSLVDATLRAGQPVAIADLAAEKHFAAPPLLVERGARSGLAAAIPGPQRPAGLLGAFTARTRAFTADEAHFVQAAASTLALAIERNRAGAEQARLLRQAEAAETKFGALLEAAPDALVTVDRDGRIVLANAQAERIFGYRREELLGQPVELLLPEGLREAHVRHRAAYAAAPRARPMGIGLALHGRRQDGSQFPAEISLSPLETDVGMLVIAAIRDLTERQRAEQARVQLLSEQAARAEAEAATQALRHANEQLALASVRAQELADQAEAARHRLAFLAEASKQLASSLDYQATLQRVARLTLPTLADWCVVDVVQEDGQIRRVAVAHVDPARDALVQELRHYPPDPTRAEGVPKALRTGQSLLVPAVSDALLVAAAHDIEHLRLLRALAPRSSITVPLLAQGRSLGAISLVCSESGRRYGPDDLALAEELARRAAVAIENARLYLQAQEGVRARDEFLSTAAHELKTPVTAIKGYAQLLRQWAPEGHEPREARAFEVINRQCNRINRLVQELLEVSRLQLGRLELRRQRFELGELAAEVVERMQPLAPCHRLTLRRGARATVEADRERLDQALSNLLDNAIKFSPPSTFPSPPSTLHPPTSNPRSPALSGEIEVRVAVRGGEAVVSVRDEGVGIPRERQAHLFEQFYRAHAGTPYDFGGMGVGLYLSREIVARHGGRMWVESQEGQGSTFSFSIPLVGDGPSWHPNCTTP